MFKGHVAEQGAQPQEVLISFRMMFRALTVFSILAVLFVGQGYI